jgi:nucleotide-binding universal stress UspA family protein
VTTVVGLAPDERGVAAVHLAAMLARSVETDVVLTTVVPRPWPPDPNRIDEEYLALREAAAEEAQERAAAEIGAAASLSRVIRRARSVSSGLLEVAAERAATLVVLGSSAGGLLGSVALGGIAQRVLHSSETPVALTPKGFAPQVAARVSRVTVAFGRADGDSDLLLEAASAAERAGASLRVACFAVRPPTSLAGTAEGAEDLVVNEWARHLEGDVSRALRSYDARSPATGTVATRANLVVGQGTSWADAISDVSWTDGDVLVVGTTSSPVSRFFLGSHASKIVRTAPVPVFLMPRSIPLP